MALLCRVAIIPALVLFCLGCTTGLGQTGQVSQSESVGGPSYQRPTLDRMDRDAVKKAVAQERQGSHSFVQQTADTSSGGSVVDSISSTFKQGIDKMGSLFSPPAPPKENKDPLSLSEKAVPTPELYVRMARLYEQQGKLDEAERQYQQALKLAPDRLETLVGLGRLRDRQGRLDDAIQYYQMARKAHPKEASVCNDLGLCYARKHMYRESAEVLKRAVELQPTSPLYRNNYAAVLIEIGNNDAAFNELKAVHGEAGACYNLGYLLYKKGQYELAARLFAKAQEKDPSLVQAGIWAQQARAQLASQSRPPQNPALGRSAPRLPSQMAQPSPPVDITRSPEGSTGPSPYLLQARRSMVPGRSTRQLPPVSNGAATSEAEVAPLPPSISSERTMPEPGMSGATSTGSPIAPLPAVTR